SPSTKYGYYSDGVALFWKPQVMSLISLEGDDGPLQLCRDSPAVHIVVALRHNFTGEPVLFACTHLKAKGGDEFEAIRAGEVSAVLDGVEELAERLGMSVADGVKSGTRRCRSIIMGDFNAEACTSSSGSAAVAIPIALNWCDGYLSSAYTLPTSHADDLYTTWKTRGGTDFKRMIDYILYSASSGLEVAAVLKPPSPEEIATSACKLPDIRYPSDHISIA
ncbi:noct, partial [Symbiodinium microadriaticum]